METFLIRLLQFVLAISLLVLLHEGGHFFFARLFKVRVEKFYLFFDPWFHLFEFKPRNSETAYGIGWVPLGGYCKISGMVDESFDTEQMKQPAQPWEFRSKPAWQRLLIIIGGVLVNFLLALIIYAMVLFTWGDNYISTRDMTLGMEYNEAAHGLGFRDGDMPVKVDGTDIVKYDVDLYRAVADGKVVTVLRDGKEVDITLKGDMDLIQMLKEVPPFMRVSIPATIDSVAQNSAATTVGLKKGDKITAINGEDAHTFNKMTDVLATLRDKLVDAATADDSIACRRIALSYISNGVEHTDTVMLSNDMMLGAYFATPATLYKQTHVEYGLLESIPAGIAYGWNTLGGYVGDLKYLFSEEGAKSLGGFGAIGSLFPPMWDWMLFWKMTAFLSIILAFMNILPIPALDGGHALFLIYEMITGRKPSEKFLLYAEYVGFTILILLLIVANLNDVLRWIGVM